MLNPATVNELAKLLNFLGKGQRLNILKAITLKEKYARGTSEEAGVSRLHVNIYLKKFEKAGLVTGINRVGEEPLYHKRYYKAVPFEFVLSLEII